MDIKEFAPQYERLLFAYDKEFKKGQMLVYFDYLKTWDIKALIYAVNKIPSMTSYFPKVKELLDLMKEYRDYIPEGRRLESGEKELPTEEAKERLRKAMEELKVKGVE